MHDIQEWGRICELANNADAFRACTDYCISDVLLPFNLDTRFINFSDF